MAKAKNHVVFNGSTLIDLRSDTVTKDTLVKGKTAHDKSGAVITGTLEPGEDRTNKTITVVGNKETIKTASETKTNTFTVSGNTITEVTTDATITTVKNVVDSSTVTFTTTTVPKTGTEKYVRKVTVKKSSTGNTITEEYSTLSK